MASRDRKQPPNSQSGDRKGLPERLAAWQTRTPWPTAVAAVLLGALALPIILGLGGLTDGLSLNSDFTAMLPDDAQSVRDLDEVQERFGGQQTLILSVAADNDERLHGFTRALAPRLSALRDDGVVAVDWNLSEFVQFIEQHRHLYAETADLEAVRDALRDRIEYERARANPFFLDLEDEEPPPDPRAAIETIQRRIDQQRAKADALFHEGFLQRGKEPVLLVVVHTSIRGGRAEDTDRLIAAVRRTVDEVKRERGDDVEVHYGGALMEVREETESLVAAVRDATLLTIALVMLAIYVFFLRMRAVPLLSISLIPPLLVTFAFAELTVDYLNASSAFLAAIVVGNGINPMIIWLARYFEARRANEGVEQALVTTHRGTWKGTLTASLAAAVSYGSLMSTDYRGFRDFGVVGGTGMVLCWVAAYLILPVVTVLFERARPLSFARTRSHKGFYGVIFARLAMGSPRAVVALSVLLTIGSAVLVTIAVIGDPMEYDFRRLRSERDPSTDTEKVSRTAAIILDDTLSGSALAVLAPDHESIPRFRRQLEHYEERHPRSVGEIQSIDDLLPKDQEAKIPVLAELRSLMLEMRPHVDDELQALIDEHLPAERVTPLGPDDLPRSIARPYTERDGTRGRLLFVEHDPEQSSWDGQYMVQWARAARSLRGEGDREPPPIAGTAVVFADVMETVWRDGPRAVGIAFLATLIFVAFSFREHRQRWLTVSSLLLGILWMVGTMALFGMRLNFLNMVAFPIAFGNNVDYAVNVMRRYADEVERTGDRILAVKEAVEGTGGAVILCSLTTAIGYMSLHTSSNQALNSFGEATAISEVTCLASAVIVLPAVLFLFAQRRRAAVGGATPDDRARASESSQAPEVPGV